MSQHRGQLLWWICTAMLLITLMGAVPPALRRASWSFETDEPGQIAAGFKNEVGRWEVMQDGDNRVLAQRAENRIPIFNLTLIEQTSYKDVDLSVRLRGVAGESERGGGVVWRAKDKDNYYVMRYNPYSARSNPRPPNIRLYKVEDGKLTQLDHAEVAPDDVWHTLRVTTRGSDISGYLDGKKLLEADDSTFLDVGKIGLWTRADAQTYFDDLTVSAFRSEESQQ
jgi:hypothetical protein